MERDSISWRFITPLLVIDRNLTTRYYIDKVLQPAVLPFLRNHIDITLHQWDNARPHSSRLTADFLGQNDVQVLPWPVLSNDLSPIEHLPVRASYVRRQTKYGYSSTADSGTYPRVASYSIVQDPAFDLQYER